MVGVYFSGTGNTKYCIERLISILDSAAATISIEDSEAAGAIKNDDAIILGYPIQLSNMPYLVREFIETHKTLWAGKKIFCVATMSSFSGDGAGCAARLLKKYGAEILGGLHIKMPSSICDGMAPRKSEQEVAEILQAACGKIEKAAHLIRLGAYPQEGLSLFSRFAGLITQRLWTRRLTMGYTDKVKVGQNCIGCGACTALCPTHNLSIQNGKAVSAGKCTMCYRCANHCPQKAITLFGHGVK